MKDTHDTAVGDEMKSRLDLLENGTTPQRQHAIAYIGLHPTANTEVVQALCQALLDDDPVVREFAITGIENFGVLATAAIPAMKMRLGKCNVFEARMLLWALPVFGFAAQEALPEILIHLASRDMRSRYLGIRAVGVMRPDKKLLGVVEKGMLDESEEVRSLSAEIFRRFWAANFKKPAAANENSASGG